jgi:uncharacterized protein (TIGR02646 family)
MRHIKKRNHYGHFLRQANANPPLTSHEATSRWGRFGHKSEVLDFLLDEQYALCCYSETRADELNIDYHIEHIENKRLNPPRTFDASNLAASAISEKKIATLLSNTSPGETQNLFGGHASGKQKAVDIAEFVSPHQEDCSRFFTYVSDGRIVPAHELNTHDNKRAAYTIDLLNLNSPYLIVQRRKWWDELDELFEDHTDDRSDISCLVRISLVPCQGRLYPFFSITRSYFKKLSEDVLRAFSPELL